MDPITLVVQADFITPEDIIPIFDCVLIRPMYREVTTGSGLVLPGGSKDQEFTQTEFGFVERVGPWCFGEGLPENHSNLMIAPLEPGMHVIFRSGGHIKLNPQHSSFTLLLIRSSSVASIIGRANKLQAET